MAALASLAYRFAYSNHYWALVVSNCHVRCARICDPVGKRLQAWLKV